MECVLIKNQWYYIAFIPSPPDSGIYTKFQKKGFNHVVVFFPNIGSDLNTATYFTLIEHVKTFVSFGVVERDGLESYLKDATIIRVKSKRVMRAKWYWWLWTPNTCVTIAKQILGIRSPFVLTTYQLYKYIKRNHKWADL